jgi:hydroxyacylglutathione hydrolase
MIFVKTFYAQNDLRNFSYLIGDDTTGDCWVIDPYEAKPMIDYIKKSSLNLKGILNTHQHFDHIRGNSELQDVFKSPISKLKGSGKIQLNDQHQIAALATPGHTMDHEVFVWKDGDKSVALFSGDTLFNAGVGNCKNGGNVDMLYTTTGKLIAELPKETLLYPGHDYVKRNLEFALQCEPDNLVVKERLKEMEREPVEKRRNFTLAQEAEVNPFLRLNADGVRQNLNHSQFTDEELFKKQLFHKLRSMRDNW